jgi:hypothetical protein
MTYPFPRVSSTHWRFTLAFFAWASLSTLIGIAILFFDIRSDVRSAIAWQFIIWGGINLLFALNGIRTHRRFDSTQARGLIQFFVNNSWMNVAWTLLGVVTLAIGLWMVNAGIITHGVCVIIQALFLVGFDQQFKKALVAAVAN